MERKRARLTLVVQALLIGFLSLVGASSFLQKKCVSQVIPGRERVRLILPNYWSQVFGSTVLLEREGGGRAKLFYGLFEQPFLLLPGREPSTVMCVYTYDTLDEVLVFDLGAARLGRQAPIRDDEILGGMVRGSELPFRKANMEELRFALKIIREMSESSYERAAVPTADLGWFRIYAPRRNIVALMERVVRDTISPPQVFNYRWPPSLQGGALQ